MVLDDIVFPTPVGVFPFITNMGSLAVRLPHARGGVSIKWGLLLQTLESSPRPWGCFTMSDDIETTSPGLPHARGGVSIEIDIYR